MGYYMKVLTLKQPWATLICDGMKEYEFRSWKTSYRGPLLIHAGMGIDQEAIKRFESFDFAYPKSEIICLVELIDCIKIDESFHKDRLKENRLVYLTSGVEGYAWKVKVIKKLSIKNVKGELGLWNYPYRDN